MQNLIRLCDADHRTLLPDVVGWKDFLFARERVCDDLSQNWRAFIPGPVELFPYPNGPKLRQLAVLRLSDLLLYRAVGGLIAMTTDPLLLPAVFSSRLLTPWPAWSLRDGHAAHRRMRELAADALSDPLAEAWVTDVSNYYGSVSPHRLLEFVNRLECSSPAVRMLTNFLDEWSGASVPGLPIGPEPSGVLGTAFLMPVDQALATRGHTHFRYTDDIVVVGRSLPRADLEGAVTESLAELQLERSESKTHLYPPFFAREAVEDLGLRYIAGRGRRRASVDQLMGLLEQELAIEHPDVKHVRFALNGLIRDRTPVAAMTVCANLNLLNADPDIACRYLAATSMDNQATRDALLGIIESPASPDREALRLHALRAIREKPWGGAEGRLFQDIATDEQVPSATRAEAWMATLRTPAWRARDVMGAADSERHPAVRRAVVLTLRRAAHSREKDIFLTRMSKDPYVYPAAMWAAA